MKVTLMQVPLPARLLLQELFDKAGLRYMPLNIAYLGAVLEQANHEVKIVDINIMMMPVEQYAMKYLDELDADIVGLSCTTNSYIECMKLAELIKKRYPETLIIVGGCHVTFMAGEALEECEYFDIIVRGEGENTIVALVDCIEHLKPLSLVDGISYRLGNEIIHNKDAALIKDLDTIPFPARHLLQTDNYPAHGIVSSRGCPRKCIFCSAGAMGGGRYRIRSAQNIVDELKTIKDDNKSIFFYDNTFSTHIKKSIEICQQIIKEEIDIKWQVELRADTVTEEFIRILSEAGCEAIQFGVESGNEEILKEIKKYITKEDVRKGASIALSYGLGVACSFIVGHPSDTEETLKETLEFMIELKKMGCDVYPGIIVPYPGTEIYDKHEELGINILHKDWSKYTPGHVCVSTKHLSRDKLGQLFLKMVSTLYPEKVFAGGVEV
mgnify:FL=1